MRSRHVVYRIMIKALALANVVLLSILLTGTSGAQSLDDLDRTYEVIFDDFLYNDTTAYGLWSGKYDRQEQGSIFGLNKWWVGEGPYGRRDWSEDRQERTWHRFGWENHSLNTTSGFLAGTTVKDDGVTLWTAPGHPKEWRQDPMLRSAFVRTDGVWAARIRFQDLRRLDYYAMQSFWTTSAFTALDTSGSNLAWSEIDHEWNNWFAKVREQQETVYDHTAYFAEKPDGQQETVVPTRAHPGADAYSCRHTTPRRNIVSTYSYERCIEEFLNYATGEDGWIVVSIHYFGRDRLEFRIADVQPGISYISAFGMVDPAFPPTQAMSAAISQFIPDRSPRDPNERLEMTVDWFYYADEPGLSLRQITEHVDDIRAMEIPRFRLIHPDRSYEPIRVDKRMISDPYCEDCARTEPHVTLVPPSDGQGEYLWVARPTNRATRYRVYWKVVYHYSDGYQDPDPGFALGTFTRGTKPEDAPNRSVHGEPTRISVTVKVTDAVLDLDSEEVTTTFSLAP